MFNRFPDPVARVTHRAVIDTGTRFDLGHDRDCELRPLRILRPADAAHPLAA